MKTKLSMLIALVMVITLCLTPAVASAAPITLTATGAPAGNEDRIVVPVAAGTTLGNIASISWQEWLVFGYPPHVDIILDKNNDNVADDALVFEYAYNNMSHYTENNGLMPFGAVQGAWYNTFNDDGNGPSAITNTSYGWLASGAPGPPIPAGGTAAGHTGGTLAQWKAGAIGTGITATTTVLRLEIEVDSWVMDCQAQVRNILVVRVGSSVSMNANVPDIVAISVSPANINFGTVLPGNTASGANIVVANIGTHEVDVNAQIPTGTVFQYLELSPAGSGWLSRNWPDIVTDLAMGNSATLQTQLPVPAGYTPGGRETATIVFIARASP